MAGVELGTAYLSLVASTSGLAASVRKGMGEVETEADKGGKSAGNKMSGALKLAAVAGFAAAGVAAVAAFTTAVDKQKGNDKVAASLGLSAKQSKTAGSVAGDLYAGAWGGSMEEVNGAVESVMSSIDGMAKASPANLKSVTAAALDIATAFEVDVDQAATNAGILMKTGLAGNATEAMDLITAALQNVPKSMRGEVMDATTEYSDMFSQLGFTGSEAMGLLASASENGQYGIDKMGDAIKEFTIRSTDMSDASAAAYEAIGLDQKALTNDLLAGGDRAQGAFDKIVDGIQGIKDPAQQSQAALALFGTPLEDLGTKDIPKFLDSLTGAESSLGNVKGAAKDMGDTLNDNLGTRIEGWKRSVTTFASDGMMALIDGFESGRSSGEGFMGAMSTLGAAVKNSIEWIRENKDLVSALAVAVGAGAAAWGAYTLITKGIPATLAAVKLGMLAVNAALRANPIGIVITAITALVAGLVWFFTKTETGRKIVAVAWAGIKTAIAVVVDWWNNTLMPMARKVFGFIGKVIGNVFNWVKKNWPLLLAILTGPIGLAVLAIAKNWDKIKEGATKVKDWIVARFNAVRDFFEKLPGRISKAFGAGWDWLKEKAKNVIGSYGDGKGALGLIRRMVDFFTGLGAKLSKAAGALWDWLKEKAKNAIGSYDGATGLLGSVRRLVDFWTGMGGRLSKAAGSLWSWLTEKLKSAVGTFSSGGGGIRGMLWSVVNFISKTLPGKIKAAAKNIWSGLVGNALDVVGGVMKLVGKIPGVNGKITLNAAGVSKTYEYAQGGVLPGYTPGRDVHDFYSPTAGRLRLSGGEAIMRPEFTRAVGGAAGVARLNAAARKGQAFKDGGIWTTEKFKAPSSLPGFVKGILNATLGKLTVPSLLNAIGDKVFGFLLGGNEPSGQPGVGGGVGGGGLKGNLDAMAMAAKAVDPTARVTSGYRPGAITVTGVPSMHGQGRAIDLVSSNMGALWDRLYALYGKSSPELFFSGRSFSRFGKRGAPRSDHWDHVHWAMKNGGVLPKLYDQGGWIPHGGMALNMSGKPEAVLDPEESRALKAGIGKGDTYHIHGPSEQAVMSGIQRAKRQSAVRHNMYA